ncbi:hypothetical protein CgunFtcFv8_019909 [Champsocephalus gunnari]|uniref:Uncharacterized protein n=1 Tax=Champsocephalus gunnari TaxID=52237 RepID=A0AAN8DHZ9_CHAGU|nr:hypothetical protein CgunFtcFv8_019909 [Champsocephalus gunnari]
MVGASMVMKDPGGPPSTEIVIPHTMQTPCTVSTQEINHTQAKHTPQTLHEVETVTMQTLKQRHARPNDGLWQLIGNDESGT